MTDGHESAPTGVRRTTRQRTAVSSALAETGGFLSARDLHDRLAAQGERVGIATVYRTLASLASTGEVDVLLRDDGESVYRRCSSAHHHHLVCRECGRTEEVTGPTVEAWATAEAERHGFRDVRHTVEITGICATCTL
ncbi:MAG: transcriptional repressor [Actinobacteria bacterium]|nr:transcriptional repressor [Actinomycetota bacterium]